MSDSRTGELLGKCSATGIAHQYRQLQIKQLKWKAASLGYEVTPIPAVA
jgi:hypothetical protein